MAFNSQTRPYLDFSIESILRSKKSAEEASHLQSDVFRGSERVQQQRSSRQQGSITTELPWLSYSRYCPPKIPRSRPRYMTVRRKINSSPRIPFSTEQLAELEKSYETNPYISTTHVSQLSASLGLPGNRIKIWFQNRRAREKKKSREMLDDVSHTTSESRLEVPVSDKSYASSIRDLKSSGKLDCSAQAGNTPYSAMLPSFVVQRSHTNCCDGRLTNLHWERGSLLPSPPHYITNSSHLTNRHVSETQDQ